MNTHFARVGLVACFLLGMPFAAQGDIPLVINHQGRINVNGTPFNGMGSFRFALADQGSGLNLWTNDGSRIETSQPPELAIDVAVSGGVYSVALGDTSLPGMTALPAGVFDYASVVLRVWFDDRVNGMQYLTPDQRVTSSAYAFHALYAETAGDAQTLGGMQATDLDETADIADAMGAHDSDPAAHPGIALDAARITSGTLSLGRIPQGTGSGLDADLLDGQHASAFMAAGADNWVNITGDTMTGPLVVSGSVTRPLVVVTNASANGIQGSSSHSSGSGLVGQSTGSQGKGVYGESSADTNDINYGGYFRALGQQGRAVYGVAASDVTMTKYGGYFWAKGGNGIGCRGEANGSNGKGIYGYATNEGAVTNYGGYFLAKGTDGRGCYASGPAYDYYAGGAGTNYGPFTGGHEVRLAPDSLPVLPGMVVSSTGLTRVRTDEAGAVSLSSTLPDVTVSAMPNDPAVLGVFVRETPLDEEHWYAPEPGDRFGVVNALGEGRVWVCDVNGSPRLGDYVTTSAVPGYAQRQDDDLLRNYTLGKVIEQVDWDAVTGTVTVGDVTCRVYLIAVVYTSG